MAISYPLALPTTTGFTSIVWAPKSVVGVVSSRFTYHQKKYVWDGQTRKGSATLPALTVAQAKLWQSFILKLNGREGSFYLRDSEPFRTPQGAITDSLGSVIIDTGGGVPGTSIDVAGLPTSETDTLLAGDYISIDDRLYQVTDDVTSDGGGLGTINIWPFVRSTIVDATSVEIGSAAQGIFQLTEFPEFVWDLSRLQSGLTLNFEEVL
jgi:hypothetical protein